MSFLGHGDDGSVSTSSSHGRTILSSLAPSSLTHSFPDDDEALADDGAVRVPMASSLSLSLNPSMVDSSVFIPARPYLNLPRGAALSQSSVSSGDASSCDASCSSRSRDPDLLFANIGRSLALASVSSGSNAPSDDGTDSQLESEPTGVTTGAATGKAVKWWDQLQTDEDWDHFRASAHDYLNALVAEEMKEMKHDKSVGDGRGPGKTSAIKEATKQNGESSSWVRQWLEGLYAAVAASAFGVDADETSLQTKHISSLVREMADVQRQLEGLPPPPPGLPEGLPLDALPAESRDLLLQYRDRLDAWRGEAMPRREELSARYVRCQEKLLAAIIDAEEAQFWSARGAAKFPNEDGDGVRNGGISGDCRAESKCHAFGAVNDDGYIEVIGNESPLWDDVTRTFSASQGKCQLTLGAALFAALTAGAGFLLTLQSKHSR